VLLSDFRPAGIYVLTNFSFAYVAVSSGGVARSPQPSKWHPHKGELPQLADSSLSLRVTSGGLFGIACVAVSP
jgi:hypothetical protein